MLFRRPVPGNMSGRLLKTSGKEPAELHLLLSGCIGVSNAAEFESWCSIYRKLPSVEDILSGRCTAQIREMDVLYALVSSLLACVSQRKESLKTRELETYAIMHPIFRQILPRFCSGDFFRSRAWTGSWRQFLLFCPG